MNRTDGPTGVVLTRQGLRIPDVAPDADAVARGGYVRRGGTDVVLIATGSEVQLAEDVAGLALEGGLSVRVVSMPCLEVFERQDAEYQSGVIGADLPVFALEAGVTRGWMALTRGGGVPIGIDRFGASAPAGVLAEQFGFTPEAVLGVIIEALETEEGP